MDIPRYLDRTAPVAERVEDLLSRMTPSEKVAQMSGASNTELLNAAAEGDIPQEGFGGVLARKLSRDQIVSIVKNSKEKTRLGIPPIVFEESLHGLYRPDSTVFPQSLGMASSFDEKLVYDCASVIGAEARNAGIRQTLAPVADMARDPRWGRVEENYGEDPYLTSRMVVNYIKALQSHGVSATVKHFAVHGSPEGGINIAPTHAGEREWRESMIEPFEKAVSEAGVMSVMPAYSEVDGIPLHSSRKMLTEVLRDELGFDGYVISDFGAMPMIMSVHHAADSLLECGRQSLNAGVDMEATARDCYGPEFLQALEDGSLPQEQVDEAVRRILSVKFRLGLFDEDDYIIPVTPDSPESSALSKKAAYESMVLLKNDGTLPICENFGKILLVGPNADTPQLGDYSHAAWDDRTDTLRKVLESRFGDRIRYHKGCSVASGDPSISDAISDGKDADIVIVVLGDNSTFRGGIGWGEVDTSTAVTCGEGFDSSSLELPLPQKDLLREMKKLGKPVVLVLENGRPYCIGEECSLSNAVLEAWYPGENGGEALADILFGKVSPSGKLPVSFARSVGHLPCFYNYKVSARGFYHRHGSPDKPGRDYIFDTPDALFPFGFGLSYTEFRYSDLKAEVTGENSAEVSVTVENVGDMASGEPVLLFISQETCPVTPFIRRLRGFKRVYLEPGEKQTVRFSLGFDDIAYIGEDMKKTAGRGRFTVTVSDQSASFTL